MNNTYVKRRYLDLRLGGVTINPIIQASNFVMISYIVFQDSISFWVYAPLFFGGIISMFTLTGLFFRRIQLSTDEDLKYEKQKELNKTLYHIMLAQCDPKYIETQEFTERMAEVKRIADL